MSTTFFQPFQRMTRWATLLSLLVLALVVAACGGDSGATTTTTSSSQPAANSGSSTTAPTTVTVTITEKTGSQDIYAFDPANVNIKVGDSVKWVNNSDENHLLASDPMGAFTATSIVARSGSNDNTYQMTFNKAGIYNVTSTLVNRLKDGQHTPEGMTSSAKLTITVQ